MKLELLTLSNFSLEGLDIAASLEVVALQLEIESNFSFNILLHVGNGSCVSISESIDRKSVV